MEGFGGMKDIKLICHSSVRIVSNDDKVIYFDPFKLNNELIKDADIIFISHPHYDHFSPEDILKIKKEDTKIVVVDELFENAKQLGFSTEKILKVKPCENHEMDSISFETVPAYNANKKFHPKESNWVRIYCKN